MRLGKVYAASGFRQSNSRAVNWALTEVDESQITSNKVSPGGGERLRVQTCIRGIQDETGGVGGVGVEEFESRTCVEC